MLMRKVISYVNDSDFPVISLVFTTSATVFTLALISFIQILDFIPITQYPLLIFISSAIVFGLEFLIPEFQRQYKSAYNLMFGGLIFALLLNVLTFHPISSDVVYKPYGFIYADFIFVSSISLIALLKNSLSVITYHTSSYLKNYKLDQDLVTARNTGTIFAAVYMLLLGTTNNYWMTIISGTMPAIFSLIMLYYVQQVRNHVEESFENVVKIEEQLEKTTEFTKNNFPFLYSVFSLFFVSFFVIEIQQFVTFVGLYEFKSQKNISSLVLYSGIAIAQTALGLLAAVSYNLFTERKPKWGLQFKSQFWYSAFSFLVLIFKTNPITLIFGGSISRLIHLAYGENNDKEFFSNIPKFVRSRVENITKTYVYIGASAFAALTIFFAMKSAIPMRALWGLAFIASVAGIFIRVELQKVFADYHVGQIIRGDMYEAVECCHHLATPEAHHGCSAITAILHQGPRPFLAKALLNVLGAIEKPEVVPELIQYYKNSDRDDIKLAALKALTKYESHHIDLFLLESLEEIIREDKFTTDTKRQIFTTVAYKIKEIAIPMILKALKTHATEFRVVANAILILGAIAEQTNDDSLYLLLSKYTKPIYSRRIRGNASLYLYRNRRYREIANSCMSSLLTSSNEYDRNAVAYMAGELKVYSMTPFIIETSESYDHSNTTLLISLLKLDYPHATDLICDMLQSNNDDNILAILSQVNMIKEERYRYKIYYRYLELYSDKINHLLEHMSLSGKNFDDDRMVIRNEAIKLGCYIINDKKLFLKGGTLHKAA